MERELIRRALTILGFFIAVLASSPAWADAALDEKLQSATRAFEMQNYDSAVKILRPLIASDAITDGTSLRLSLERLAASYWFTGAADAARLTFGTLLKTAPDHPLDPLYYPQELISFFEAEKQRLKDLGFIGKSSGSSADDKRPRMTLVKTITERPMPTAGYLMPFGVGQFANNDGGKGTLLAVLQGIGLATNIAAWLTVEALKKPGTNLVSESDAGRAEVMDVLWWIGTSLFVSSYTYSMIDGLILRPPELEEQRRFELMGPDEPLSTPSTTWQIGPGPGLGVGLSGTF